MSLKTAEVAVHLLRRASVNDVPETAKAKENKSCIRRLTQKTSDRTWTEKHDEVRGGGLSPCNGSKTEKEF